MYSFLQVGSVFVHSFLGQLVKFDFLPNCSLVLLNFNPHLKFFHLIFQQFHQKLSELVWSYFSRFVRSQNFKDCFMLVIERSINLTFNLIAFEECSHKLLNLHDTECSSIVGINCIVDVFAHLHELIMINEDICEVLDSLIVICVNNRLIIRVRF